LVNEEVGASPYARLEKFGSAAIDGYSGDRGSY
jgi:hypothetical protein